MGVRFGHLAAALGLLACTGCGVSRLPQPAAPVAHPMSPALSAATAPPETPQVTPPPYVDAHGELATVAGRFVHDSLSYDACATDRGTFPAWVETVTTRAERRHLRSSGRANLDWRVACQRHERATVRVDGISQEPRAGRQQTVHVEVIRTTHSDISTVREFLDVTLVVVPTAQGWRVESAAGGGL